MTKTPKKKDDPLSVGRHVHGHYGYEVLEDGGIKLAPGLCSPMDKLIAEERGLKALLEATNAYAAEQFTRLRREQQEWWKRVAGDIPISIKEPWAYNADEQKILKQPKPDAKAAN